MLYPPRENSQSASALPRSSFVEGDQSYYLRIDVVDPILSILTHYFIFSLQYTVWCSYLSLVMFQCSPVLYIIIIDTYGHMKS